MRFSVIIPTLNEEDNIENQIKHIRRLNPEAEIIIADGGSRDNTRNIAETHGAKVIDTSPGRGVQQRAGASHASHEVLLFLHADTVLPCDAFIQLEKEFRAPETRIATFRISFYPSFLLLRIVSLFSRFDTLITRYGDQCIVIRKSFYNQLGGFPNWRLFEDIYILEKARRYTGIHSVPSTVTTSSRRFMKNGVIRQLLWNAWLVLLYRLGRSHDELALMYNRCL